MFIRKATAGDLLEIMKLYTEARRFMRETGNPTQWGDDYPSRQIIEEDIALEQSYVCEENGEILAVFVFRCGNDPTYRVIIDGAWPNDEPYGVIHRIAVHDHGKGIAGFCYAWCSKRCRNLRIDTHLKNLPMQCSLEKAGFARCGTIFTRDGTPRETYWKRGMGNTETSEEMISMISADLDIHAKQKMPAQAEEIANAFELTDATASIIKEGRTIAYDHAMSGYTSISDLKAALE